MTVFNNNICRVLKFVWSFLFMRIHHLFLFVTVVCFTTLQRGEAALASTSGSSPHPNSLETKEGINHVILDRVVSEHKEEINFGYKTYGSHPSQFYSDRVRKWEDDDLFHQFEITRGNAGPDEDKLGGNGHVIFQSKTAVFSSMECDRLVSEAKHIIENRNLIRDQDGHLSNEAIGEVRVSNMPQGKPFLQSMMHEMLFPLLESRFNTPSHEMTLHDALIIGYGHLNNGEGPSKAQPIHRDSSLISLNIALSENDSYEGGGTYFEGLDGIGGGTIHNSQGHVLCHSGGIMHAGQSLKSGVRFVLVLFILAENIPQIARRCHAMGTRAEEKEQYSTASAAYSTGLNIAQRDHCLLRDFGRMNIALGRRNKGIKFLRQSDRSYAYCASCLITIGRIFLDTKRP